MNPRDAAYHDLREADARMRALDRQFDTLTEVLRERGFQDWCRDTYMPQAVNRWVAQIGARA